MAGSKVEIGNMALGLLGLSSYATNMDAPISTVDRELARWYDQARLMALRTLKPDFARIRRRVARLPNPPAFGYAFAYERPTDVVAVLGIGDADDITAEFNVEAGEIQTDEDYATGLPLRGIYDERDVSKFTPEFVDFLALELASRCSAALVPDLNKRSMILSDLDRAKQEASALSAQENKPIRVSRSRWQEARVMGRPWSRGKK